MSKPRLLVVAFSHIERDPRVSRQVASLSRFYDVTVSGYGNQGVGLRNVCFVPLISAPSSASHKLRRAALLKAGMHERYYWTQPQVQQALASFHGRQFDLVLANDIETLPLALELAGKAPVHFDAHEYHPREFESSFGWRMVMQGYTTAMCARYIPRAASMSTVSKGIAQEYLLRYGVRPSVVMNAPAYRTMQASGSISERIRLVYHGLAIRSRKIEGILDMFAHLDRRFSMILMLVPSDIRYLGWLRRRYTEERRIQFHDAVPMNRIIDCVNANDLGISLFDQSNFNHRHALPNKFFEYIQARVGVAVAEHGEMADLVREYRCGVVLPSANPAQMAEMLNSLDQQDIEAMKSCAGLAARTLCWEENEAELFRVIDAALDLK